MANDWNQIYWNSLVKQILLEVQYVWLIIDTGVWLPKNMEIVLLQKIKRRCYCSLLKASHWITYLGTSKLFKMLQSLCGERIFPRRGWVDSLSATTNIFTYKKWKLCAKRETMLQSKMWNCLLMSWKNFLITTHSLLVQL